MGSSSYKLMWKTGISNWQFEASVNINLELCQKSQIRLQGMEHCQKSKELIELLKSSKIEMQMTKSYNKKKP